MRTTIFTLSAAFIAGHLLAASPASARDPSDPDPAAPEQAAMQAAQPSAPHAALAKLVGEWTTRTEFRPEPGAPAMESTGTSTISMHHGGRFMCDDSKGEMMGAPVTSHKTIGFNNGTGKYEAVWTYAMSTGMLFGLGTSDDGGKTVRLQGTFDNGPQGGGVRSMYMTLTIVSDNQFTWEIRDTAPGEESRGPVMLTTYTRK